MGSLGEILARTGKRLSNEDFQNILLATQRTYGNKEEAETWEKLLVDLWKNLDACFDNLDDQLLCSTCFYAVLQLCVDPTETYGKIYSILENSNVKERDTAQVVSLIYGMYQSSFFASISEPYDPILDKIVVKSLEILLGMGYEYSRFTFITFKIISILKKLLKTALKKHVLDKNIQLKLLNLCNHNWENPLTGVRDMNRTIFRTVLSIIDTKTYKIMLNDINGYFNEENNWCEGYYWNKAKYLMLTELIENNGTAELILEQKSWIEGVIYSLRKPGLVSAGTDMYFAMLKKINSDEWKQIFTTSLTTALNNYSGKFVENFGNYWCLSTLKNMPELFDHLMSVSSTYCKYFVLKQGNKVGLVKKDWLSDDPYIILVKNGLDSADIYERSLSFDVLCLSYNIAPPADIECALVVRFIENNINVDSSMLRMNMVMSLKSFLNRLHGTFFSYRKSGNEKSLEPFLQFCKDIQQIVIDSLNKPGNYQRKITSLKLCDVIFTHFTELPRQKHTWSKSTILIKVLNEKQAWKFISSDFVEKCIYLLKDVSADIRDHVIKILLHHYFDYLKDTNVFNRLIKMGLDCIKSKFFYEIYCGISIFKLLTNILIEEEGTDAQFNRVEDIFMFAYNSLKSIHTPGYNIVQTIESGTQLHSFVAIMSVVIEHSLKNNYQLDYLNPTIIDDVLDIMETQSMNFASQNEESGNSDFCKIDGIIRDTIKDSGYENMENVEDAIKISDMSQIVLNSMWLNAKECCVLAAVLIKYLSQAVQEASCRRCLNVMTNVLETSRHKGAMEAAGVALGQAVQHLTWMAQEQLTALPKELLETKLEELISRSMTTASVTRRGAGLSILVHQIVLSDSMKGKPLFHFFMQKLLLSSWTLPEPLPTQEGAADRDHPKAMQIHFLTRIVSNRGFASDVMHYAAELSQLAFVNLTSPHWQIRNAALQLYGALIPKLIGQNKQSGTGDSTVVTVAVDEFRTHFPQLWQYILEQIAVVANESEAHTDLVPILNLIGNCAKRYHFSFDNTNELTKPQVFNSLSILLSSPIVTVRKLTAKCICNNYPFFYIIENIMMSEFSRDNENEFHGRLLVYEILYINYSKIYRNEFEMLRSRYLNIFRANQRAYCCKIIMENVCNLSATEDLDTAFQELYTYSLYPGAYFWMGTRIAQCFENAAENTWPELCKKVLQSNTSARYLQVIQNSIATKEIGMETKKRICHLFLDYAIKRQCGMAWKYLYELSSNVDLELPPKFDIHCVKYHLATRYALPVVVKALIAANKVEELIQLCERIFEITDLDTVDCDMKFAAMLANNELGLILPNKQLPDYITAKILLCAVIYFQEEDEVIRYESINFYNNITAQPLKINPYICLKNIFQSNLLKKLFKVPIEGIKAFCDDVDKFVEKYTNEIQVCQMDYNPFSFVVKNIYVELEQLQNLANNLRLESHE